LSSVTATPIDIEIGASILAGFGMYSHSLSRAFSFVISGWRLLWVDARAGSLERRGHWAMGEGGGGWHRQLHYEVR
jgi:hypothetical protein